MSKGGAVVGALACQKDSYLRTLKTTVLSCTPLEIKVEDKKGKKAKKSKGSNTDENSQTPRYEVELKDTVLFPEGGGQPSDRGYIIVNPEKKVEVLDVQRKNLRAVHIVEEPIENGIDVELEVNWRRRLDHMQQHTGQHLLSAILDKYELPTLSWNMGEKINYIEIPRKLTDNEMLEISQEVNDEIFNNTEINIEKPQTSNGESSEVNEEKGILRIVKIGQLDENPCCGTHLSSVGQIKAISLLGQVKGKGTNNRINFISGDRVYKYTAELYDMSKKLMNTLSSTFDDLDLKADGVVKQCKKLQQKEKNLNKELANMKAVELIKTIANSKSDKESSIFYFYREDGALDFINLIYAQVKDSLSSEQVIILIGGIDGSVIVGSPNDKVFSEIIQKLRDSFSDRLKGGGKGGRFQGKVVDGVTEREMEMLQSAMEK